MIENMTLTSMYHRNVLHYLVLQSSISTCRSLCTMHLILLSFTIYHCTILLLYFIQVIFFTDGLFLVCKFEGAPRNVTTGKDVPLLSMYDNKRKTQNVFHCKFSFHITFRFKIIILIKLKKNAGIIKRNYRNSI